MYLGGGGAGVVATGAGDRGGLADAATPLKDIARDGAANSSTPQPLG